jgi:hypothetical protein
MSRRIKAVWYACALATSFVVPGCDGIGSAPDATSSKATGLVKGKVTVGGKPLAKAEVRFNASNVNRTDVPVVSAPIKDDGSYEVTTLVGQNQVSLTGPGVAKSPRLSYYSKTIDVKSGENEFDIVLP